MAPSDDDSVTVPIDERRDVEDSVIRIRVLDVPESDKFPEGIKYTFHYGEKGGDTILRYDNHHGVHERHDSTGTDTIDFPGFEPLLRRFQREIDHEIDV